MKKGILFIFFAFLFNQSFAQEIVKINGESYLLDEFVKDYSLNIKAKGKEKALEDFVNNKLLLQDAKTKQIDSTELAKHIIKNDVNKVKMSYFGVDSIKNNLMKLAVERGKVERKILFFYISSKKDFAILDTIGAKTKMRKFLMDLQKKNPLEKIKQNNPDVESLNQFNPFFVRFGQMAYELENLVFDTKVGSFSAIKIINNKCYLVKVLEERESYGTLKLKNIFVKNSEKAKEIIDKAYAELLSGKDFSEVMKNYSQDERTKHKDGDLPIYDGNLNEDILKEVLAIKNTSFTKPILQEDGWYIFYRLNQEKPCQKLMYCKTEIEEKVLNSDRKLIIEQHLVRKASEKTPYTVNKKNISKFLSSVPKIFYSKKQDIVSKKDKKIVLVGKRAFYTKELTKIVNENKLSINKKSELKFFVQKTIDEVLGKMLLDEYMENSDQYEPNYSKLKEQTIQKALIYVLLEHNIYKKAQQDEQGIRDYYKMVMNQPKYLWPRRLEVDIYYCYNKELTKSLKQQIEKNSSIDDINKKFNEKDLNVFLESGLLFFENPKLKDLKSREIGIFVLENDKDSKIFHIKNVLQPTVMSFEEAQNIIYNDYKEKYLEDYIKNLKNRSKIIVNTQALNQI